MQVFSGTGQPLGAFVWDRGRLALFAWTGRQQLLIMDTEGQVRLSLRGARSLA